MNHYPFPGKAAVLLLLGMASASAADHPNNAHLVTFPAQVWAGVPPVQGPDGNFYGVTVDGNGSGTFYRMTAAGVLTTLYNFCSQPNCTDGAYPDAELLLGADGNFYGSTETAPGTLFKVTPEGMLTTLYNFCSQPSCQDGQFASGPLIQGADGSFYGETAVQTAGKPVGSYGTIFRITPSGALTTLYRFCSQPDCADGYSPSGGLVEGADGTF